MYEGAIFFDGEKPLIKQKEQFIEYLKTFPADSWFSFVVTPLGAVNNTEQSKLYHKWLDIIGNDLGWTHHELHTYLKGMLNGGKSTKGMNIDEWSKYMTKVLAWASEQEITLPLKEDN